MEQQNETDLSAFRAEVRDFIADKLPSDIREAVKAGQFPSHEMTTRWQGMLAEKGWAAPHWPVEHGGQSWSTRERGIFADECEMNHCPALEQFGLGMIGPLLITYGSEEQKQRFLAKTLSGEIHWCQGYSEPGAGSDLASLKTRAVRDGDYYIVNGSKIWTSLAHHADWMFCLVRTDTEVKKQEGISMLLIETSSPGLTIRPIIGLNGLHYFNEVFFDDVKVPADILVGEENRGWTYGKALLSDERLNQARTAVNRALLERLKALARTTMTGGRPLLEEDAIRRKIGRAEIRLLALEATKENFTQSPESGERLGPEVSSLKLRGTELIQHLERLLMEIAGDGGLAYEPAWMLGGTNHPPVDVSGQVVGTLAGLRHRRKASTIAGGSSEVQRMILAKRVLGL